MKILFKSLVLGVFLSVVYGCSSTGTINIEQPLSEGVDHNEVVALAVEAHEATESSEQAMNEAVQRLKSEMFGRLVSEGVFKQVVHKGELAKYHINVKLLSAREVSQGARVFLGVLAGSNALAADVTLLDLGTGEYLAKFTVSGESASHPFSSENDMDDAIREMVNQIVNTLNAK